MGGTVGTGGSGSGGVPGRGGSGSGGTRVGGAGGSAIDGGGGATASGTGGTTAVDGSPEGGEDVPGIDGIPLVVYSGCSYIGGIERAAVARFDGRGCVTLVLESPHVAPDASFGMTITQYWGVAAIGQWPSSTGDCATLGPPSSALGASSASGSVTVDRSPGTIDIDAVFNFPATDWGAVRTVEMKAQGVVFMRSCRGTGSP
jgi:hypothetical protein